MNLKPMLSQVWSDKTMRYPAWIQPKLDGIRALYYRGKFYSRTGVQYASAVVAHITAELDGFIPNNVMLDGEFYKHGSRLQDINAAIGVNNIRAKAETLSMEYHVFDCVVAAEQLTFQQRFYKHVALIQDTDHVKRVLPTICTQGFADTLYEAAISAGYEGAMYRLGNNYYTHGIRSKTLLKRKKVQDAEASLVEVLEGKWTDRGGKYQDSCGAIIVKMYSNNKTIFFKIGTGFDDQLRAVLWAHKLKYYGKQLKFNYEKLSRDGIPLKPVFITFL